MKKFFFLIITFLPAFINAQYVDYWTGKLSAGMIVTIELNVTYKWPTPTYVTLDCPEQDAWEQECKLVKWSKDSFIVSLPMADILILGKKTNHDSILEAKWIQNGASFPIIFNRSLKGIDPVRPQSPSLTVDYVVEDISIHNGKDNVDLFGTLTIPKGFVMKGCAVLVSGSGAQDKEESIMGHKPFWVIADFLTRNGYAVMRFDDRGSYRSSGNFSTATIYDFANDVNAAIDMAKERTGLPDSKIGLIGHSEGGIVSQIVIKDRPLAFFISLAGPGAPIRELMYQQNRDLSSMFNIKQEEFDKTVGPFLKKILSIAGDLKIDSSTAINKIMNLYNKQEKKFSIAAKTRFNLSDPLTASAWLEKPMRTFLSYVPADALVDLKIPVLALNGARDKQVNSKLNLDVFRKYVLNNPKNEVVEIENKNHLFQSTTKGDISEYGKLEETFSPDVLNIILNWLNKVFQ